MDAQKFVIENNVLNAYTGSDFQVEIPDGIVKIGDGAFAGNSQIKEVTFPKSKIKSIGKEAFSSCKVLEKITLPQGLFEICEGAFKNCPSLKFVYIPSSVVLIGENVFDGNKEVVILGETGSEAEKYANRNSANLLFSTNSSTIMSATKKIAKNETKAFNVFGETIKCSNSLIHFQSALEYYESRKDYLFNQTLEALPLSMGADLSKILNIQEMLNSEELLTIKRVAEYGLVISKGEIAIQTATVIPPIIQATKTIAEFYVEVTKCQQETIAQQAESAYQEAESNVRGLSFGLIGNSFDMAIYALDDFRARQKQRREAYAKAEAKITDFQKKATTSIQKQYAKDITEQLPVVKKLIDNYADALRNAEIIKLTECGVIDQSAVNAIDLEKSTQLLQKAFSAAQEDKSFLIAKALEKYPCNCAAIAHATEQGLTCDGLDQLIDFIGLQKKVSQTISANAANRHAERYEKVAASLSSATYHNRINALINEEKEFSKDEIRNLLQFPIPSISNKLLSAIDNPDIAQEYTPEQYAKSKLYAILPEAQWDFYKKYDVFPLNGEKIPVNELNTYANLLSWFQSKIQDKEDKYIRACEMLESGKTLSEARCAFEQLKGYKQSEQKLVTAKQILKKRNRKIAFASLISVVAVIVAVVLYTYCIAPPIKAKMATDRYNVELPALQTANVGDVVTFGNYKGHDVEWVVYESSIGDDGNLELTMFSRYVLFAKPYGWGEYKGNGKYERELDSWIHSEEFINSIFGIEEQNLIKKRNNDSFSVIIPDSFDFDIYHIEQTIPTYIIGYDTSGNVAQEWWSADPVRDKYGDKTGNIYFYDSTGNKQGTYKSVTKGVRPIVTISISTD